MSKDSSGTSTQLVPCAQTHVKASTHARSLIDSMLPLDASVCDLGRLNEGEHLQSEGDADRGFQNESRNHLSVETHNSPGDANSSGHYVTPGDSKDGNYSAGAGQIWGTPTGSKNSMSKLSASKNSATGHESIGSKTRLNLVER